MLHSMYVMGLRVSTLITECMAIRQWHMNHTLPIQAARCMDPALNWITHIFLGYVQDKIIT